jgi:hypothetical protein
LRCRGEEAELYLVAASFYQAGRAFLQYVRSTREAAALYVAEEEWAKAAQLLDAAATAWINKRGESR